MFLVTIAHPRLDQKVMNFLEFFFIFSFVAKEPTKRSSVTRVAGTLETKAMT